MDRGAGAARPLGIVVAGLYRPGERILTRNKAEENGGFGFRDDDPTVNTYTANKCEDNEDGGSLPTGLCSPQP